jgi:hypothetical protein
LNIRSQNATTFWLFRSNSPMARSLLWDCNILDAVLPLWAQGYRI